MQKNLIRLIPVLFVFLTVMTGSSSADEMQYRLNTMRDLHHEYGLYFQGKGNCNHLRELVEKAILFDSSGAQYIYGEMYYGGVCVEKDIGKALGWYRLAAEQENSSALKKLADMYYTGDFVKQDYAEALKLYKQLEEQGDSDARNRLIEIYLKGSGAERDFASAYRYFDAQRVAKRRYTSNLKKYLELFKQSSEEGVTEAQWYLGLIYLDDYFGLAGPGKGIDLMIKSKGLEYLVESAQKGDAQSQYILGAYYILREKDDQKAFPFIKASAEQGHVNAQWNLALMYNSGKGTSENTSEARVWLIKAAESGHPDAQQEIGTMCLRGLNGVEKDTARGIDWIKKAADGGNTKAKYILASLYSNGEGVEKDVNRALYWLRSAAGDGHPDAQFQLSRLNASGDLVEACARLIVARQLGHKQAEKVLNKMASQMAGFKVEEAKKRARKIWDDIHSQNK